MKWRVMVELGGAEGALELREVSVGERETAVYSAETLGLTVAEGKKTLAGLLPGQAAGRGGSGARHHRRGNCSRPRRTVHSRRHLLGG